ncbi:MAG: PaaI family thioesterase [Oscillospiraceae bacterium]|nr:PaaI family thioesterase [Oscillospiraceae bacterium]
MAHQLTTQELRRRTLAFLQLRAREIPAGMPDPSADLTLLDCDGLSGSLTLGYATKPWMANVWGVVHGGVTAALVDSCMGITCGIQCGLITPTISMTINYARPVPLDASIVVRTRTVRCGATAGHIEAEVYPAGQPETLLVTASGAYSTKPNSLSGGRAPWEEEPAP